MIYHVAKNGCNKNVGTLEAPFKTIQKAADIARPGDTILVHEGEYREWVDPKIGGLSSSQRITYKAAEGEHVVIKGSEIADKWDLVEGNVYKTELPNAMFGDFNPFEVQLMGDWWVDPWNYTLHAGDVYLNGKSMYEAESLEALKNPERRTEDKNVVWAQKFPPLLTDPDFSVYQWRAEVGDDVTTVYANFQGLDPNKEFVEVSVRPCVFYPKSVGINYITVSGFELCQAATTWAPPTANQIGLIGPHWAKGWVIENNNIHDAKCSAISIGKEASTGDNDCTRFVRKPGYQTQMEAVFKAHKIGWSKEKIGSHVIRNNVIHHCGQNGVVGHLGCVFCEIYGNEIYEIATKYEFYGYEIAAIKMHAAIDTVVHDNYIHDNLLGCWLDWEAQGCRVTRNIFAREEKDLMVEVSHGPYMVDNNILTSGFNFENVSQGGAYINNIALGNMWRWDELRRSTPYHLPHSTDILSTAKIYGGDDRWMQNLFVGGSKYGTVGTADYNGHTTSMEEYSSIVSEEHGDEANFSRVKDPVYINNNVYLNGAENFEKEVSFVKDAMDPEAKLVDKEDGVYFEITLPEGFMEGLKTKVIVSDDLPMTRISEARFDNPDGSDIMIGTDLLGQAYGEAPVVGALQCLKAGKNSVKIWKR